MPIPELTTDGLLPEGVHDATLVEIGERFGQFQRTDQRCQLFRKLEAFMKEVRAVDFIRAVIVDGSFVTGKPDPGDIDLILVVPADHDFNGKTRPFEYNVVSTTRVRRRHGFDVAIYAEGAPKYVEAIRFFERVRENKRLRKGLLRIVL